MNILATVLVIIADLIYVVSMLTKKKSWLVILLLVSDIFFTCQYLCYKDGLTGSLSIVVDILFLLVVYLLEKYHKEKYTWLASLIAIVLTIVFGIISWSGAISILPLIGMTAYLLGMIINKLYFVKGCALIRNTMNIIYMFLLSQYVGAALEIALAISAVVGIILSLRQTNQENVVVENNTTNDTSLETTSEKN